MNEESNKVYQETIEKLEQMDNVKHPIHYHYGNMDRIEHWYHSMNFDEFVSSMITHADKYIWRHRFKGKPIEDLDKAIEYLTRLRQKYVENQ